MSKEKRRFTDEVMNTHEKKRRQTSRQSTNRAMLTHRGVHDSRAVCSDGVGNVSDVDGV